MKKIILLLFVAMAMIVSCNKKLYSSPKQTQSKILHFQNELFSIDYPSSWEYDEEWNDMCDSIPALTRGFRLVLYNSAPQEPWPTVTIQRSSMPDCFHTPENWRDANKELSNLTSGGKMIGVIDGYMLDSLSFGGYPAALGAYVFEEDGDTIVQKQMVVKVNKDYYFLSNAFLFNDQNGKQELLGDSIMETIRFNAAE